MKVLLINPKNVESYSTGYSDYPPLGLLYIAAYVRSRGIRDIEILDCVVNRVSQEELYKKISQCDVVGAGGFTSQFKHAIEISKICKKLNKLSVCGGVHVSTMPVKSLEVSNFDIAVKGEGEITFYELLKNYNSANKGFDDIDGLVYRSSGKIIENQPREYIENLEDLPLPARDLLSMEQYMLRDEFFSSFYTHIQSTRGCPFECTFCNSPKMWNRRVRARSAQHILSELLLLKRRYGFRCFQISDDGFTYRRDIVREACNLIIKEGLDIEWACISRPELLDRDLLRLMRKAGCIRISIGVESADLNILEKAKKRYSLPKIEEAVALIKEAGILVHCYMMIGLPGENIKTYFKSIQFMRKIKPDRVGWAVVVPYPGTELFDKRLVDIVNDDYLNWGGYLRPVIRVGKFSPLMLRVLQLLANFLTQKKYQKRNAFVAINFALFVYLPVYAAKSCKARIESLFRFLLGNTKTGFVH